MASSGKHFLIRKLNGVQGVVSAFSLKHIGRVGKNPGRAMALAVTFGCAKASPWKRCYFKPIIDIMVVS